jgi:hypothetical protein
MSIVVATAAVAMQLLIVKTDGVPTSQQILPVTQQECSKIALDIMLDSPRRGPVITAECKPIGAQPASPAASEPKKE